jgi:ATP-dependent Clp protease ATP-binding subunit ClpA
VIVVKDEKGEKLGFEYLEGPVTPKPEKAVAEARAKAGSVKRASAKPKAKSPIDKPVRTVPKVPL